MAEQNASGKIMWTTILVAAVLTASIYALTNKSFDSAANSGAGADEAELRIQPVAKFELAKADVAAEASAPKDGPTVYNSVCGACHNTGVAGAPKIDAKADWAPRLPLGEEGLFASVINGKNAMPARGGSSLSDDELKGALEYMLEKVK